MTKLLEIPKVEGAFALNQRLWFEYHCNESHDSADAELWYRSHQKCVIVGVVPCDGYDIHSADERYESGCLIVYRIRFDDGQEFDACEDELMQNRKDFCRPDPPITERKSQCKSA